MATSDDRRVHPYIPKLVEQFEARRVDRREFLRTATLLGMSASVAYGIVGIRDLRTDPLLVALGSATPAITKVERIVDGWGTSVRFHLPGGAQYRIYFDAAMADEVGRWLDRPA